MRKAKIIIEQLGDGGIHIFCRGKLNGTTVRILIDTGASKTVISKKLREEFKDLEDVEILDSRTAGIGKEMMQADFVILPSLEVGGIIVKDLVAGVIPLDHVDEMFNELGIKPFQMILGGDFLLMTRAVVDYRKKEIRFASVNQ